MSTSSRVLAVPGVVMLRAEVLVGAGVGFLVLGVGGRVVMRMIAAATEAPSATSVGGTVTVIAAGIAAGVAGGLLHAVSRVAATWAAPNRPVVRIALFAALLALVTARGLRGSAAGPSLAFRPLVLLYGTLLDRAVMRRGAAVLLS